MTDMFSRWSYRTKEGDEIPIPIGVSKPHQEARNSNRVVITITADNRNFGVFNQHVVETLQGLVAALSGLLTFVRTGLIPGTFHTVKRTDADQSFPPGVTLLVHLKRSVYKIQVHYPCLITNQIKRKYFYLGTENTWSSRIDSVTIEAIEFREKQIELYRLEFIKRAEASLQKLKEELNNENHRHSVNP